MSRSYRVMAGALAVLLPLAAHAGPVRNREAHQQRRISQGIGSGQITARGAQHLETREGNINRSRDRDLAANGGHLTGREQANLNRRENSVSRNVYRDKHNDIAQPGVTPVGAPH